MPNLRLRLSALCKLAAFLLILILPTQAFSTEGEIWLQVDTRAAEVKLMRGTSVVRIFEDIAIGRFGTTSDKRRMDGKTQLGEFRVSLIKNNSGFYRFFGLDYPKLDQAERAFEQGALSLEDFQAIRRAVREHRSPPQNTALGGHLGIHGIGSGDPSVHTDYNWTKGCIALTNAQIDELTPWLKVGTRVVIY